MVTQSISNPTPSSIPPNEADDNVLSSLHDFITKHKIDLSSSLEFRRVPSRGLGIYATADLPSGERIMHVPSTELLTTASIPSRFASKDLKSKLPVHVLLAAYIAFGMTEEKKQELQPWMATWPQMHEFVDSMCLWWPERMRRPVTLQTGRAANNGRAMEVKWGDSSESASDRAITFQPVPQCLTGSWLRSKEDTPSSETAKPKLLDAQLAKFHKHISLAFAHFRSHIGASPSLHGASPELTSFIHAWAIVNTRCFYHLAPGKRAPKDSNEAIALVPVMDLFNHTNVSNCKTSYDRKGFYINAGQAIPAGQELLLSYGAHGNDLLWTEYGFTMDANGDDSVAGFDELVLEGLTLAEKDVLQGAGYLGNYMLTAEGFCWRSEVVSWLGTLSRTQWLRFVEGTLTPETADRLHVEKMRTGAAKRRKGNDAAVAQGDAVVPSAKAREKQLHWLALLKAQVEVSLEGLAMLGQAAADKSMLDIFADTEDELTALGWTDTPINDFRRTQAKQRLGMCLQRWTQLLEICNAARMSLKQRRSNRVSEDPIEDVKSKAT
ncbi:uncharacterized protein A1O9_05943 [Exophiala aquamarina CBS 119918]|uniref:SET domain-containing protein n=1 Tax=Exophiala aquamarina CBS 119918 TaxID=1182545 RepID=A0A072PR58_9EURO|nr:uncharacterized protein A1O9_05943 [Exophiala aquamarina CBS 119918]KEF58020.1 hypothetical protein A1O9_05943 [Exophiala aquamarina CBS 119918]